MCRAVGSDIYGGDVSPYSENVYEQSALGRIIRRQGPGKAWRDADSHTDTEFCANRADGELQCLDYRVGDDGRLVCLGVCPAGTLYVTKTTDEDGGVSYEFTDMFGDRQLVRRILDGRNLDTYYVYDGLHHVCYVLPPAASSVLTASGASWSIADNETLRNYAYYYRRDGLGRILEKKLPGAEPILYVNDRCGNAVFSQNGVQRNSSEWSFQLYDDRNRPTVSGRFVTAAAPSKPQTVTSSFTGGGSLGGYTPYAGFPAAKSVTVDLVYYLIK